MPNTTDQWTAVADDFEKLWNFPNCIGALDGERILLQAPIKINTGSFFYDYKQNFSMVLMALVDAQYRFLYVDVGANGRQSDAQVFGKCGLNQALLDNSLNIPHDRYLPNTTDMAPFVIVADDAFPLRRNLMKPFPDRLYDDTESRVFNYRLSRARRIVENAFGILANRWRVLRERIMLNPIKAEKVVKACCVLHNFLRTRASALYAPSDLVDQEDVIRNELVHGTWRNDSANTTSWLPIARQGNRGHSNDAKEVRDSYKKYFNNTGQVEWQWRMI